MKKVLVLINHKRIQVAGNKFLNYFKNSAVKKMKNNNTANKKYIR